MDLCLGSKEHLSAFSIDLIPSLINPSQMLDDPDPIDPELYEFSNDNFHNRFDHISLDEGFAILTFLNTFIEIYGESILGDIEIAIEEYWSRYKNTDIVES